MSIYSTTAYLAFPERDGLGRDFPDEPAIELSVDYTTRQIDEEVA